MVVLFNENLLREESAKKAQMDSPPVYSEHASPDKSRLKKSVSSLGIANLQVSDTTKRVQDNDFDEPPNKKSLTTVLGSMEITTEIWLILSKRTVIKTKLKDMYDIGVADGLYKARKQLQEMKDRKEDAIKTADELQSKI